ncbi:MAG: MOSC domain-containing protein [Vicinamibacterales bacterium]
MYIAELWRYPVKSMAGERLVGATLGAGGIDGDRRLHVEDGRGRTMTARTHAALLGHRARTGPDGEVVVDERPWYAPEVAAALAAIAGPGSQLVPTDAGLFDILPLLVATDGAVAAFGYDGRRLRPNLVVGGVDGLAERSWEGAGLRIGDVLVALADLRGRCVMTTVDPDSGARDPEVLKSIVRRFGGTLALNASVEVGGRIREGDRVELVPADEMRRLVRPTGVQLTGS